ncbi:hypothetical protein PM082_021892 [Marasmius tenuissimus]|nr:hypothetical protein PM082_020187 [Marasmius tenuissimus]KAJ8079384.1 hypothetical protein PM082_021892 [Marasmius tenuissimus]
MESYSRLAVADTLGSPTPHATQQAPGVLVNAPSISTLQNAETQAPHTQSPPSVPSVEWLMINPPKKDLPQKTLAPPKSPPLPDIPTAQYPSPTLSSAMFPAFRSPWQFDIVSLDELSDTSSNEDGGRDHDPPLPPGLPGAPNFSNQHRNRPQRRLPTRRVMEVTNDDRGTVSSMGIVSRHSHASTASTSSVGGEEDAGQGLGRGIQQWQLNELVDSSTDDEELGMWKMR